MSLFSKLILVFVMIIAAEVSAKGFSDFINEGDSYYKKFDNVSALNNYEEAYSLDNSNYEVLFRLARTYNDAGEEFYELRKMDEAEKYINKALKFSEIFKNKYPDSAAVYTYMGMSYGNLALFKGGNEKVKLAKKIEENVKKAMKMDPNNHVNYTILGIYNRELASLSWLERAFANTFFGSVPEGSYEQAIKYFKQALKIDPNMIVATYQLSKTYRKMDDEKKEIELLKKVVSMPMRDFRDKFAKQKSKKRLEELGA
jgi:tetratricopeptide (TPR) repeat protein